MKTMLAPGLSRTTGPTVEPITLAEAKDHCEIASSEKAHDAKLARIIRAAREQVENDTWQSLITQTFTMTFDEFPVDGLIKIPMKPIQSVTSITYYDSDNSQQTLSSSIYGLTAAKELIYREYNESWPSHVIKPDGIEITFVAGYGDTAGSVPNVFKQAMLLQISKWFEHRGDEMAVHGSGTYDQAYDRLIRRYMRATYP